MRMFADMLSKEALGWTSVLIGAFAYVIYARRTIRDESIQPHPLSWFVWAFVTGVATVVQWERGAGAGAWVTALTTVSCIAVWLLALFKQRRFRTNHKGNRDTRPFWRDWNWISFALGMFAAICFGFVKNATAAAILATVADLLGYKPTFSKGWTDPFSDSALAFFLNSIKFVPAYFALDTRSIATALYPVALIIMNFGVSIMLLWRKEVLLKGQQSSEVANRLG